MFIEHVFPSILQCPRVYVNKVTLFIKHLIVQKINFNIHLIVQKINFNIHLIVREINLRFILKIWQLDYQFWIWKL